MTSRRRCIPIALIVFLTVLPAARAAEPFRYPEGQHGKGELKYVNGLPVLTVEGTPEEIGTQIAVLAGKPASRILTYPREVLELRMSPFAMKTLWPRLIEKCTDMVELFPPDYRQELDAFVKAGGFDRELVVAGNTMFDMKNDIASVFGCSAVLIDADRSATRQPLFGRNLDYPSLGYAQEYSLVTVYRSPGKHAFAAVGFPGLVGCLSGMNDAGLSLGVLEVFAPSEKPSFDPKGLPYALCYRQLLEECTTVDEAEKLLRSLKRATTSNLAICDRHGGAVFEVTPSKVVRRAAEQGVCTCTNHFCTKELEASSPLNLSRSRERLATLDKVRTETRLDVEDIHKSLHAVNHQSHTLQTMVFEPATLRLHLAIGKAPASGLELKVLELRPLLAK